MESAIYYETFYPSAPSPVEFSVIDKIHTLPTEIIRCVAEFVLDDYYH